MFKRFFNSEFHNFITEFEGLAKRLEGFAERQLHLASSKRGDALQLQAAADNHEVDANRANQVAENLKKLVGG